MKGIPHPKEIPSFHKEDKRTLEEIRSQAAKNPWVPGPRLLRKADARKVFVDAAGCWQWLYPLSEVNDFAFIAYVEKEAGSDQTHPWASQSHPGAVMYLFVLEGGGTVVLGAGSNQYQEERHGFVARDFVVIPRGMPYYFTGEWKGLLMQSRSNVYGLPVGVGRYVHPILTHTKPPRPTAEEAARLAEPGTYLCTDPTMAFAVRCPAPVAHEIAAPPAEQAAANQRYWDVTPTDGQTQDPESLREMQKNAWVLGARVIRHREVPALYNANAAGMVRLYPTTWSDDMAIFTTLAHKEEDDAIRPFDSHSHLDIEECKYVMSGSGWIQFGVGDDTFETETYEFHEGDVILNPRSVPHYEGGTYEGFTFHSRMSVFGKVPGTSMFPHIAYVYTRPWRPNAEEEAATNEPGTYIFMDSRESTNMLAHDPFIRVEKNPIDMTWLRPDIFPAEKP